MFKILLTMLFLNACNYKIDKVGKAPAIKQNQSLVQTVSFKQLKAEVLDSKCITCHGNAGGVNLENYENVYREMEAIRIAVFDDKSMPKSPIPALTARQLEVLDAWIKAGGPNEALGNTTTVEPSEPQEPEEPTIPTQPEPPVIIVVPEPEPTLQANFDSIKKEIFDVKCMRCHGRGDLAVDFPLATKEDLINSGLVVPGKAFESQLFVVVQPDYQRIMPPKRSNIPPLTQEERDALLKWINNGAL